MAATLPRNALVAALAVGFLATAAAGTAATLQSVSPLEKVVGMLQGMLTKGTADKHAEEVAFAQKQQWCDSTREETSRGIAQAAAKLEQLQASIMKAEADAEALAAEVAELHTAAEQAEAEAQNATAIRGKERADYAAEHQDLTESIAALSRAAAVLKQQSNSTPQALLQVQMSSKDRVAVQAWLEIAQTPEARVYETQSGGVLELLENLRQKFEEQRLALEKEETAAKSAFEQLAQKLVDNAKDASSAAAAKEATKAQRLEEAGAAKGELAATQASKAEDEKKLQETIAECQASSQEYESNQAARAGEIKALEAALQILHSEDVSGVAEKYGPALLQLRVARRASLLLQVARASSGAGHEAQRRAASLLQSRAQSSGSRYLLLAAVHAQGDPFAKVKALIENLIARLMEEANSEADHKAFCNTELATNRQTLETKQMDVEQLTAQVERHHAERETLAVEIKDLAAAISELQGQVAEATQLRGAEKAKNLQVVADAKAAQLAVQRAVEVLRNYYASAEAKASLLQQGGGLAEAMSQATKAPYQGMLTEHGNVVAFLEVVLSDFARLEAQTSSAEDAAEDSFQRFTQEAKQDLAVKEAEASRKGSQQLQLDGTVHDLEKELELTQQEAAAAAAYAEKLRADCVDTGLSYEERVQQRMQEVESLKEALRILTQEDLA